MSATRAEEAWLGEVRALILRGQLPAAQAVLDRAFAEYPSSTELRRVQAGAFQQAGREDAAESILRTLLEQDAGDASAAFTLARILKGQGRTAAAAAVMGKCFAKDANLRDAELAITAIELLADCNRQRDAAHVAEAAIALNPEDARLHAYAAMLQVQLGEFEQARQNYLSALERDGRAWEWHVSVGLSSSQRYCDDKHLDFARFRAGLRREELSDNARAELHFALGKAHDDIGNYAEAAHNFRMGNTIRKLSSAWSRKAWRRTVEARLACGSRVRPLEPLPDFTPVFIVGMPRSGTTLLAERLSRYPDVRNRGELPWIARLSQQPELAAEPDRAALARAASLYVAQARQDDADDARWFLDKQPLNFRYVDLMLTMFPNAKIVHCVRDSRDTALSLWMQCFLEDVQGYSYDFDDIALVMRDCERLMTRWRTRYPGLIRTIRYEDMVTSPQETLGALAEWIGLRQDVAVQSAIAATPSGNAISTASLWQARQPVNTRSVLRWKNYAPFVPQLLKIPNGRHSTSLS